MKGKYFALLIMMSACSLLLAQNKADSLVLFSDLKYHSEFERKALYNFVHHKTDTFNLFLAIDESMTSEEAKKHYNSYMQVYNDLIQKKIESKKLNSQIKIAYSGVHSRFLKKYNSNEFFPVMLQSGTYNCVSASMLYSLVYDHLKIPFKVMAASDHVYLVANPGTNSVVIETTNPSFEKAIFTGEFKRQYVDYVLNSKLISEAELKSKSTDEIFEEKYNEVKESQFNHLPGFQYYNKAIAKLQNNDNEKGFELCQKAYYFYPDNQVKALLYNALLFQINKCDYSKVSDIDYLAQLARFENTEVEVVVGLFNNVISNYLQYTNKERYCDSLFQRLASKIRDKKTLEEISFAYYLQMSYRFQNSNQVGNYVGNALKIKGNHHDANVIMENYLHRKLSSINEPDVLLDTIQKLETKYNHDQVVSLLKDYKLVAYLKMAGDSYKANKITLGEKYLLQFEEACSLPFENKMVSFWIENTYYNISMHYLQKKNKPKSKYFLAQGLKYVPTSSLLKTIEMTLIRY